MEIQDLTDPAIAEMCGVTRQAVSQWRGNALPPIVRGGKHRQPRMSHKAVKPWRLASEHTYDELSRALTAWSTRSQGRDVRPEDGPALARLDAHVDAGWVVDYDCERGFRLVRFDPALDRPGAVIREPRNQPAPM